MKWKDRQASRNVEDRRGQRVGGKGIAGIGGGFGLILVIVFTLLNGGNPADIVNNIGIGEPQSSETYEGSAREEEMADFVSVVLRDTEEVWTDIFAENGLTYREPTLVIYKDQVESACGIAGSAVGPFYCPGDQKLYIDLSFYDDLSQQFNAPGDFAMAYVVAHEVGHHVQTLLGTTDEIMPLRNEMSETQFNKYLVRFELQADYYAGVWAYHAQGMGYLEAGDVEEAMNAAHQIGDDTLQKQARGYVTPDSFTHGTSEQRKRWFDKGFQNGTIQGGDTFNSNNL